MFDIDKGREYEMGQMARQSARSDLADLSCLF
jgi:hypothetical protein